MNNTKQSPEPKKESKFRQPTPEELKQDEELIDRMLKAANEKIKQKGWKDYTTG